MAKTAYMKVWNVELGLAVHIKAPNGKYIVIDLGSRADLSPISKLHGKEVGYMVITHPHHDHFSDIRNLGSARPMVLHRCKSYSRKELLEGVQTNQKADFEAYCDLDEAYTSPVSDNERPSKGTLFDGLTAEVYSCSHLDKTDKNNFSSVVIISLGNAKIVVCGDNTPKSLEYLMSRTDFKSAIEDAWVLVAPHHGRDSGYFGEFVSAVNPYVTVISDTKVGSTSVTEKYENYTRGWTIHNMNTLNDETRKCLSTRNDGNIKIEFGESETNQTGVLSVSSHVSDFPL